MKNLFGRKSIEALVQEASDKEKSLKRVLAPSGLVSLA